MLRPLLIVMLLCAAVLAVSGCDQTDPMETSSIETSFIETPLSQANPAANALSVDPLSSGGANLPCSPSDRAVFAGQDRESGERNGIVLNASLSVIACVKNNVFGIEYFRVESDAGQQEVGSGSARQTLECSTTLTLMPPDGEQLRALNYSAENQSVAGSKEIVLPFAALLPSGLADLNGALEGVGVLRVCRHQLAGATVAETRVSGTLALPVGSGPVASALPS